VTITAINRTTKVVTFSAGGHGDDDDGRHLQAGRPQQRVRRAAQHHGDTSRTLHGINSATAGNEFWNGAERDAAGAIAGEGFFELLADDVGQNGEGDVEVFLTTRGIRRRLADTYQSTKRFNDARAVEIHGGYTAIFVNEIPVIIDDDVPKGWAFALRKDAFLWVQLAEPDWLSDPKSGLVWHLAMGSVLGKRRLAWQAWMTWYAALACVAPNRTGRIINARPQWARPVTTHERPASAGLSLSVAAESAPSLPVMDGMLKGLLTGDDVIKIEPPRASLGQLQLTNRLEMIRVEGDVLGVAESLQRIDRGLTLMFDKGQGIYVLYHVGLNEKAELVEKFIGAYTELDQRIVNLIERLDAQGRGRYDLVHELDQLEKAKDREQEAQRAETFGPLAEQLRHALRKDLGATGSSVQFRAVWGSLVTALSGARRSSGALDEHRS
jgi:hypothetical protein